MSQSLVKNYMGAALRGKNIIIGHIVIALRIGLHPMVGYNALSGL
jgi:hypothetical protein